MKDCIKFDGEYYKRSSKEGYEGSVPSEREILELNPDRKHLICTSRSWDTLVPGTFNVRVTEEIQDEIRKFRPEITEGKVKYPDKYASIAEKRGGYYYWKCKVYANGKKVRGLCRMAKNPVKGIVEVLSNKAIESTLDVKDGDKVKIKVYGVLVNGISNETHALPVTHNYFRNARGESLNIENLANGGHAFLISSGPSFNLVDKNPLRYCYTMGLNNSPKSMMPYFRPNVWTCADGADKFLYTIWADPKILKLVPDSHVNKSLWDSDGNKPFGGLRTCDMPNVGFFSRNSNFNADTFLDEPTLNWGCGEHTCSCGYQAPKKDEKGEDIHAPSTCPKCGNKEFGGRSVFFTAIKILYLLGFRHIYLLGVDFEMKEGEQNYSFAQDRKPSAVHGNNSSYEKMKFRFKKLRETFDKNGLHIYNCNRKSGLDAFEFLDYEEALRRAMWFVPDYKAYTEGRLESTSNLYETKWYVCPDCKHHQRISKEDVKVRKVRCPKCDRRIKEKDRKKYVMDDAQKGIAS
jgi:hypothetical protein